MKIPPETHFQIESGNNISDRIAPILLRNMFFIMKDMKVPFQGKMCTLKLVGEPYKNETSGEWELMFDVMGVEGFDHIEFILTQTGWGREI